MLISEIRDEIIDEVGQDNTDTIIQGKIFNFIKSALRKLPRHLRDRCLITISYATLSSGEYSLSVPPTFVSERQIWYTDGGERKDIEKVDRPQFNSLFNENTTGVPQYYSIFGKMIEFDRKANQDYTIECEFFKSPGDVALADAFFGGDDLVEIIKDLVKGIYYGDYEEDAQKASIHLQLAQVGLEEGCAAYLEEEFGGHVKDVE